MQLEVHHSNFFNKNQINEKTNVPKSKQQGYTLRASCDVCNDGMNRLFAEEVQNLSKKLPFACLHSGFISSIQLNLVKEGAILATPMPGFTVLPDMENEPNEFPSRS